MSGRVGDLSPRQEKALEEFRAMVEDVLQPHHDDYFLLRWLRARKFDVRKAKEAMCKSLMWRKDFRADTILEGYVFPEVFLKYCPGGHIGCDKEGHPVRYQPLSPYAFDLKGVVKALPIENILRLFVYLVEKDIEIAKESSRRLGKVVEKASLIADMKDFPISLVWNKQVMQLMYSGIRVYEDNYPEQLNKIYVINFSSMFMVLYKIIKNYSDKDVFKKIHFYGTDGYQEALLEDIDAEVLPAFLGGTRVDLDGDPRCPSVIKPGGIIDPQYYMKNTRSEFSDNKDVKTTIVQAQSEKTITVDIVESDSLIQCEFLTENHDIEVGLLYRPQGSDNSCTESLVPSERVECHEIPKLMEFHCARPGTYIIRFDNTYSWFRQKTIKYRLKVIPPP